MILDASAVIAVVRQEPGSERVAEAWRGAVLSAVNYAEIMSWVVLRGGDPAQVEAVLHEIDLEIAPFSREQARVAGNLVCDTKRFGLSLADRACLALALERRQPILTADRVWENLDLPVDIQLIR